MMINVSCRMAAGWMSLVPCGRIPRTVGDAVLRRRRGMPRYNVVMTRAPVISSATISGPKCYQSVYSMHSGVQKPLLSVELRRFELLTSSMRTKRSTN